MLIEQAREQGQEDFVPDLQKMHAAGKQLLALIQGNFLPFRLPETDAANAAPTENEPTTINQAPAGGVFTQGSPVTSIQQGFILVVDDIEENRDVLSRRLKRQGYAVATSENGREALGRLRSETFDLVLLDIMMPEMDGYEVLQRLKADETLRHLPVIMISALSEFDSVVRCIGMGADDYLPKPFNPTLLKARIGACLEKKRARDREQELAAVLHAQNNEMAHMAQGTGGRSRRCPHDPARHSRFGGAAARWLAGRSRLHTTDPSRRRCLRLATAGRRGLAILARRCHWPRHRGGPLHNPGRFAFQPCEQRDENGPRNLDARERRVLRGSSRTFLYDSVLCHY